MFVISWWSIIMPALTYIFGLPVTGFLFAKISIKLLQGLSLLTGLPTLIVSLLTQRQARKTTAFIAFFSIVLFVLYHQFSIASIYSLMWAVPLIVSIRSSDSLFARILSAVFMGHACGTLLFMATNVVPDMYWVALLPVAFAERIIMAILLYLSILCMEYGKRWVSASFVKRSQSRMVITHLWSSI